MNHLELLDVRIDGVVLRWFLCLFVGVLPREVHFIQNIQFLNVVLQATLRVFDLFLFEGDKALFRVALSLFKIYEKTLLGSNDFEFILDLIINMPSTVSTTALYEVFLLSLLRKRTNIDVDNCHSRLLREGKDQ